MGQGRKYNSVWRVFGRSVANWQPPVVLEKLPSNRARRAVRGSLARRGNAEMGSRIEERNRITG